MTGTSGNVIKNTIKGNIKRCSSQRDRSNGIIFIAIGEETSQPEISYFSLLFRFVRDRTEVFVQHVLN